MSDGHRSQIGMPDDLYDRDILAWSENQASLLRRLARGERVKDVDWDHVIEEVEDAGTSQLNAVQGHIRLTLLYLLKVHCWPQNPSVGQWRAEIIYFQAEAAQRFAASMRKRIDLKRLYHSAREQIAAASYDGREPLPSPEICPFSLDQLLNEPGQALQSVLAGA